MCSYDTSRLTAITLEMYETCKTLSYLVYTTEFLRTYLSDFRLERFQNVNGFSNLVAMAVKDPVQLAIVAAIQTSLDDSLSIRLG